MSGLTFVGVDGTRWRHDNRILETEHFHIFSDASSDEVKLRLGRLVEENLANMKEFFEITDAEIGLREGSRLQVFAIRCDGGSPLGQFGGPGGFAVFSFDSSIYLGWSAEGQRQHERIICHESVHTVHFKLAGLERRQAWFVEGLAEHVSDTLERIETLEQLAAWRSTRPDFNPVGLASLDELPVGPQRFGEYYPMFHLAVRYLLDPDGLARTGADVRQMLYETRAGAEFDDAFANHMGLSLEDYRANFFVWIEEFLRRQETQARRSVISLSD